MASNSKSMQRRRLIKKYNIHFDGPVDCPFDSRADWPATRSTIVNNVQKLGMARYAGYQESVDYDSLQRPWRGQMLQRARRTAKLSTMCLNTRKNELGWRFSVEVEVMARFSVEVACRTCRGRLWRSEQEVDTGDISEEHARRLQERQIKRAPCVCDSTELQEDAEESGINPLFDCQIDEAILYPTALKSKLSKREERPDRVYGLRLTRRLERILYSVDKRPSASGQAIGDTIKSHPFREDAEPVHFPFLLLEAKSEKGTDSLSDAADQTAFSIKELLDLQDNLRTVAGQGSDWDAGPLLWFLSYKGEEWKVCMAYISSENDCKHYRVVELWRGAVNYKDNALRLLLIIDYILDWARDIYREAIIRSLRTLAVSDSRSLTYQDSDIFSTTDRVKIWAIADGGGGNTPNQTEEDVTIRDALRSFDLPDGVARDIRYIQSRFLGLYITRGNLDAFLNSTNTPQESKALSLSVLTHLQEGWRVRRETLNGLEYDWTGKDRDEGHSQQEQIFLVAITVAAYLTPDWQQTRELSYIAVEEGAVDGILKQAGLRLAKGHQLSDLPFVDKDALSQGLLTLRRQSAKDNLLACISRVCFSTGMLSPSEEEHKNAFSITSLEPKVEGVILRSDTVLKLDTALKRDFVRAIYDQHQIGRNEPFCPFLRASSVLDELGLPGPSSPPRQVEAPGSRWFLKSPVIPEMSDNKVLVAISSNPITGSTAPRLCLFVMDPSSVSINGSPFQELLQLDPHWHFRVKRYDNRRGWSSGWNLDLEKAIKRGEPILRQLTAFVIDLVKLLKVGTSIGQDGPVINATEQAWAPKQPNLLRDVVLAEGLEFMSDALVMPGSHAQLPTSTVANKYPGIRHVNREDAPRQSIGAKSKGKQPEVVPSSESGQLDLATRGSSSTLPISITQNPAKQGPAQQLPTPLILEETDENYTTERDPVGRESNATDMDPGPSSRRSKRREVQGIEVPSRRSKRQRASQFLSIPRGAELSDVCYLDDEAFSKLLADGFFSTL